jgi:hypothetical protein
MRHRNRIDMRLAQGSTVCSRRNPRHCGRKSGHFAIDK